MKKPTTPQITFEKIARYCNQHIKGLSTRSIKKCYARILKPLPASVQKYSRFEILGNDNDRTISIVFLIEKIGAETLQIFLEHWSGISVLDKVIEYNPGRYKKGSLVIECDYSVGKEKICAYAIEFIYQVSSRIKNLITLGGLK